MAMSKSVLLVGCGQIGSRHLQGLALSAYDLKVVVVDSNETSLVTASNRWDEIERGIRSRHSVQFKEKLDFSSDKFDLAIVATSSRGRSKLVRSIRQATDVNYWILEKILEVDVSGLRSLKTEFNGYDGVWVHTPRRAMPQYKQLREKYFANGEAFDTTVSGGNWGLACNSIHFLDLICWLQDTDIDTICAKPASRWISSKRPGYFELIGMLDVQLSNGRKIVLSSTENQDDISIHMSNESCTLDISENDGCISVNSHEGAFDKIIPASQFTGLLVDEIITNRVSSLPKFSDSLTQHEVLLEALQISWDEQTEISGNMFIT